MSLKDWLDTRRQDQPDTGCWMWTGATRGRYGTVNVSGGQRGVHRLAYEIYVGPIPTGLNVLHHCDRPLCFNPEHLFLGTQRDNVIDMVQKGRGDNYRPVLPQERARGERHGNASLTAEKVRAIRADPRSLEAVAADYGVTRSAIDHVRARRTWRHVD